MMEIDNLSPTWKVVSDTVRAELQSMIMALLSERNEMAAAEMRGRIAAYIEILELAGEPQLSINVV